MHANSTRSSSAAQPSKQSSMVPDIEASAPHPDTAAAESEQSSSSIKARISIGMKASWAVNFLLLAAKIAAFAVSRSYSILASAVDSVVDLISQVLIAVAAYKAKRYNPAYPAGRSRLETVSVIGCAMIMATCSVLVIREAVGSIIDTTRTGDKPHLEMNAVTYSILGFSIVSKLVLWIYCGLLKEYSPIMLALAEDHWNDVLSNAVAIITSSVAFFVPKVWWIDPAAGTAVSLYILWSWWNISREQIGHIVGKAAPQEFVDEVREIAEKHSKDMQVDRIQAFHFGQRYMVEVEVVMPPNTVLQVSHDSALQLQHKIEALEDVERAHVHVDYERREQLEHKVERNLLNGAEVIATGHKAREARTVQQRNISLKDDKLGAQSDSS